MSYQQTFAFLTLLYICYSAGFLLHIAIGEKVHYKITGTVQFFDASAKGGKGAYIPRSHEEYYSSVQFRGKWRFLEPEIYPDSNGNFSLSTTLEDEDAADGSLVIDFGIPYCPLTPIRDCPGVEFPTTWVDGDYLKLENKLIPKNANLVIFMGGSHQKFLMNGKEIEQMCQWVAEGRGF